MTDAELATLAVRAAGAEALRRFRHAAEVREKRSASDPVSDADVAAQRAMVEVVRRHRPEDGLRGEEESLDLEGERRWLLDPIDGTLAFLAGLPLWSCAICLTDAEGAVASAVLDPVAGELFAAGRGGQATLNGRKITVAAEAPLRSALVRTWCDPHLAERRDYRGALANLVKGAAALHAGGSGSQALAWVACGRLDAWVELFPRQVEKAWDWKPGELLVRCAGGQTRTVGEWRVAASGAQLADEIVRAAGP